MNLNENGTSYKRMKITTESDIVLNKFEEIQIENQVDEPKNEENKENLNVEIFKPEEE